MVGRCPREPAGGRVLRAASLPVPTRGRNRAGAPNVVRDPRYEPDRLFAVSARHRTPEPELREYALEIELRQPAGDVIDAELREQVLQLGLGQVHPERSQ